MNTHEEVEMMLCGALLLNPEIVLEASEIVSKSDFISPVYGLIFEEIVAQNAAGEGSDIFLIGESLDNSNVDPSINWIYEVVHACKLCPGASNAIPYAHLLATRSAERRLVWAARTIMDIATSTDDLEVKTEQAAKVLTDLNVENQDNNLQDSMDIAKEYINKLQERYENQGFIGLSTGFEKLDSRYKGLKPADYIIIGGRSSMGKTTLALNIAENIAIKQGLVVIVFSLETTSGKVMDKIFASLGNIPMDGIISGQALEHLEHYQKFAAVINQLKPYNLFIDDSSYMTVAKIRAKSMRIKRKHGPLSLIVVDYLQLLTGKGDNREQEIAGISRELKALGKELDCAVIATAQLNRELEKRSDKRPIMSDLRESGALEHDADIIIFLYRDEYYDENSQFKGVAEIITRKFKTGEVGTDYLAFQGDKSKFTDLDPTYHPPSKQEKPYGRGFK